ncbi:PepSY-associated TM helix domain-containing protein [Rikenella microfusus]
MTGVRKASRRLHRDFSYFFAGVILIYAISGIALNHKATFNSNYDISRHTFAVEGGIPPRSGITEEWVRKNLLEPVGEENAYTKHYFPKEGTLKVFLKGGSSVVADLGTGQAEYEAFKRRPFFSAISRLHYNPGRWWTVFSDIFGIALILITITGFTMMKGRKGFLGWGGIEMLAGLLFPLAFLFFF